MEGATCGVMIGLSVEVVEWWRGSGMVRAVGDSVVGAEGWEGVCRSPAWGLNIGWMGVLGMITCEWVGGFCCVGGWLVGMLLCGVEVVGRDDESPVN